MQFLVSTAALSLPVVSACTINASVMPLAQDGRMRLAMSHQKTGQVLQARCSIWAGEGSKGFA